VSLELEKQLAAEVKKRRLATQNNNAGRAVQERIPEQGKGQARDKAAKMLGANPHYVTDAQKIEHNAPELLEQVKQGTLSIPQAKKVAALPAEERSAAIERIHKKEPAPQGRWIYHDGTLVAIHTNKEVEVGLRQTSQTLDAIKALGPAGSLSASANAERESKARS
jgi:hypothetical protein